MIWLLEFIYFWRRKWKRSEWGKYFPNARKPSETGSTPTYISSRVQMETGIYYLHPGYEQYHTPAYIVQSLYFPLLLTFDKVKCSVGTSGLWPVTGIHCMLLIVKLSRHFFLLTFKKYWILPAKFVIQVYQTLCKAAYSLECWSFVRANEMKTCRLSFTNFVICSDKGLTLEMSAVIRFWLLLKSSVL